MRRKAKSTNIHAFSLSLQSARPWRTLRSASRTNKKSSLPEAAIPSECLPCIHFRLRIPDGTRCRVDEPLTMTFIQICGAGVERPAEHHRPALAQAGEAAVRRLAVSTASILGVGESKTGVCRTSMSRSICTQERELARGGIERKQ